VGRARLTAPSPPDPCAMMAADRKGKPHALCSVWADPAIKGLASCCNGIGRQPGAFNHHDHYLPSAMVSAVSSVSAA
jgi:hypothetical protein